MLPQPHLLSEGSNCSINGLPFGMQRRTGFWSQASSLSLYCLSGPAIPLQFLQRSLDAALLVHQCGLQRTVQGAQGLQKFTFGSML